MSQLQDNVPPVAWEEIKACIESELDGPLDEIFAAIEPVPLAAASLSQVHAATLINGQEVVVKVQRPTPCCCWPMKRRPGLLRSLHKAFQTALIHDRGASTKCVT